MHPCPNLRHFVSPDEGLITTHFGVGWRQGNAAASPCGSFQVETNSKQRLSVVLGNIPGSSQSLNARPLGVLQMHASDER